MTGEHRAEAEATRHVCDFVVGYRISDASNLLLERAKDLLVDTFGVTIAGLGSDVASVLGAVVGQPGRRTAATATLIGRGVSPNQGYAAWHNGALAHALEFDDSTLSPVGHPSCVILPAVFALAETSRTGGEALLEAYLTGLEVHSRLGQAEASGWSSEGFWLPIGHVSVMGAAAGCARILGLDHDQTAHALGLAAQFCGGLSVGNATMAKPIGAGASARSGVEAALLARAGATGPGAIVERVAGFADVFLGGDHRLAEPLAKLGSPHHLEETGVAIKRYPSVYASHWGIDALLLLMAEHGLTGADIESVTLTHPPAAAFCDDPDPASPEQARFSHEFNLAVTAVYGIPGPSSYSEERLADDRVKSMMRRVHTRNHPAGIEPPRSWAYEVTVVDSSGRRWSKSVPRPLGHPRNPMGREDLDAKFLRCTDGFLAVDTSAELLADLRSVERIRDVRVLSSTLANIRDSRGGDSQSSPS